MDIASLLQRVQSPDSHVRKAAEDALRQLEVQNYASYLLGLCHVFNAATNDVAIQRLAAIVLKNTLVSRDVKEKGKQKATWMALDSATRNEIHQALLKGLHNNEVDVCCTVSFAISAMASIDLLHNQWPELIDTLLGNVRALPVRMAVHKSTLETMGYLCEELNNSRSFILPVDKVDRMLSVIVDGMRTEEVDDEVRLAATRALQHALEFADKNFKEEQERNFIMAAVGHVALCPTSADVRGAGFECLARICQIYYPFMLPYMAQIYKVTVEVIQRDEEDVAKQAIEVWSTICEEEIEVMKEIAERGQQPGLVLHYFSKQACPAFVPILLDQLMKQDEDQDADEGLWSVSMAAGTCLMLMSESTGNTIVPVVMPYIQKNINKNEATEDWRYREAATFAFGALMEGPDAKELLPIASAGLTFLLGALKDQDPRVRNTTAWSIGRIFEFVRPEAAGASILSNESVEKVLGELHQRIVQRDELHILERVCYAIAKLAEWSDGQDAISLSPFFKNLITTLLKLAFHPVESHSRSRVQMVAFEAINQFVRASKPDSLDHVVQLIPFLGQKLQESIQAGPNAPDEHIAEMQGMICGCLTVVFCRLSQSDGHRVQLSHFSNAIFGVLADLLRVNSSDVTVMEEAMTTLSALIGSGVNFKEHFQMFIPYLEEGLRNEADRGVFLTCVGTVSDFFSSVKERMEPYAQKILDILRKALSSNAVRREFKPPMLSLLGDMCLALADRFSTYLCIVNSILKDAAEMAMKEVPSMDEEDLEYGNELMLGIIEGYAGIIQGLGGELSQQFLNGQHETLMKFMDHIWRDRKRNGKVTKETVDLLGDVISKTPRFNPTMQQKRWMESFIQECLECGKEPIIIAAGRTQALYACMCQ